MDSKIQQIINEWDIDGEEVKQIYDSAWQVGENAILKTYKEVNLLQRNIKILSMLEDIGICLLYTSPSPRDPKTSRMPSSA